MKQLTLQFILPVLLFTSSFAQVAVTVNGSTLTVADMYFSWPCGGHFDPIVTIAPDTVTIVERDTMMVTTCSCNHSVITKVNGISPGSYTAMVYRQLRVHYRFPVDTVMGHTSFIGAYPFTISGGSMLPTRSTSVTQSACGISPGAVVDEHAVTPTDITLDVYPNPFNPTTAVSFQLTAAGMVKLSVVDVLGREVAILAEGMQGSGEHHISWDASRFASGIYFARLQTVDRIAERRMVLVK